MTQCPGHRAGTTSAVAATRAAALGAAEDYVTPGRTRSIQHGRKGQNRQAMAAYTGQSGLRPGREH